MGAPLDVQPLALYDANKVGSMVMRRIMILTVMMVAMLCPFFALAENSMMVGGQLMPLGPMELTRPSGTNSLTTVTAPTLAPGLSKPQTVFRDVPSISGEYSVAGTTLMPYVGAGFTNGYTTDLDRSLNIAPSNPTDAGLRGMFGQNIAPSEFQWGVRVPF
jgi:hypothetical protein